MIEKKRRCDGGLWFELMLVSALAVAVNWPGEDRSSTVLMELNKSAVGERV